MNKQLWIPGFMLVTILLCLTIKSGAQGSGGRTSLEFFNKTEIGTAMGIGKFKGDIDSGAVQRKLNNDQLIFPIQTINGFIFSNRLGIGLGVGIEFWKEGLFFPVFAHLCYDIKPAENTFFGSLSLGSAIGTRNETSFYAAGKGGLLFSLGAGYKMKVWKSLQFEYEFFYRYQSIESHYTVYYDAARTKSTTVDEKFPYHFAGFKIGIFFH
jgi:hypothetical protein